MNAIQQDTIKTAITQDDPNIIVIRSGKSIDEWCHSISMETCTCLISSMMHNTNVSCIGQECGKCIFSSEVAKNTKETAITWMQGKTKSKELKQIKDIKYNVDNYKNETTFISPSAFNDHFIYSLKSSLQRNRADILWTFILKHINIKRITYDVIHKYVEHNKHSIVAYSLSVSQVADWIWSNHPVSINERRIADNITASLNPFDNNTSVDIREPLSESISKLNKLPQSIARKDRLFEESEVIRKYGCEALSDITQGIPMSSLFNTDPIVKNQVKPEYPVVVDIYKPVIELN